MITAKLIKSLEKEGFSLEFPDYASNEERIINLLKLDHPRLLLAIPLLLRYKFNYAAITKKLTTEQIKTFHHLMSIARSLFENEKIDTTPLKSIIKKREKIAAQELEYYHHSFTQSLKNKEQQEEKIRITQTAIRSKLNLNQSLSAIFSPAKRRIMENIFNHEPLTNTELKYYYRSIRPLLQAILNENMCNYLHLIESTKKYR